MNSRLEIAWAHEEVFCANIYMVAANQTSKACQVMSLVAPFLDITRERPLFKRFATWLGLGRTVSHVCCIDGYLMNGLHSISSREYCPTLPNLVSKFLFPLTATIDEFFTHVPFLARLLIVLGLELRSILTRPLDQLGSFKVNHDDSASPRVYQHVRKSYTIVQNALLVHGLQQQNCSLP